MPFQFSEAPAYPVGTIASLMGLGPAAQAEAVRSIAQARAQNALSKGQMAGQRAQIVGQAANQALGNLGELLDLKRSAPIRALQAQKLLNEVQEGRQKVVSAERAEQIKPIIAKAISLGDREKAVAFLTENGVPEAVNDVVKLFNDMRQPTRVMSSTDASGVKTDEIVADVPGARSTTQPQGADRYLALLQKPEGTLTPDEQLFIAAYDRSKQGRPNSQEASFRLNGKDVKGDYVPGTGGQPGKYFYQGKDVTGQVEHIPAASIQLQGMRDDLSSSLPTNYLNVLDRAIAGLPASRQTTWRQVASRYAKDGNMTDLQGMIRQAAVEGENVDTKNQVRGRQATLASLADTRQILQEMHDKGVPTNILVGSVEDVARKLGTSTNPEYVRLANRLMGTLINYRRASTGVQFGEKEAADYAKMFPTYKNDLPVNLALIDGLEREMRTYDTSYWTNKLGDAGARLIGALPGSGADRVRVKGPNGERGTVPAGTTLDAGWTLE